MGKGDFDQCIECAAPNTGQSIQHLVDVLCSNSNYVAPLLYWCQINFQLFSVT